MVHPYWQTATWSTHHARHFGDVPPTHNALYIDAVCRIGSGLQKNLHSQKKYANFAKSTNIMRRPHIIKDIAKVMKSDFPQAETYLYGSEARGEAHEDSDIDLLILVPNELDDAQFRKLKAEIQDKIFDIEFDHIANISPLILQHKKWTERKTPFTVNVNNDRILL